MSVNKKQTVNIIIWFQGITKKVDSLSDRTKDEMNDIRFALKQLADETNRKGGPEAQARKAQQSSVAQKFQDVVKKFGDVQKTAQHQYKKRIEREIRIGIFEMLIWTARPDASERDIQEAVQDSRGGSAFASQMLNPRIGQQRRVLQEVQSRHQELLKLESSIEELASLFMDMQILLQVYY